MKVKKLYYEFVYKLSLRVLNFGFSVGWWWLVDKMIEVRKSAISKLLKIIIPKEISQSPNKTIPSKDAITITSAGQINKKRNTKKKNNGK